METKDAKVAVVHNEKGEAEKVVKFAPRKESKDKAAGKVEAKTAPKKAEKKPAPKKAAVKDKQPENKKTVVKPEAKATPKEPKKPEAKKEAKAEKQPAKKPETPKTLTFNRASFQKDLAVAVDFTAMNKSTMPVLSHVLLDCDGQGNGRVLATDLEVAWTKVLKVKGPKAARCVPGALLLKEIKALPTSEAEVVLEFRENIVSVNGRCKIFTLNADDFPTLPKIEKWTDLQIDNFVSGLKEVSPAMGEDDTRFTLNGVLLDIDKKRVAATDGHRLHFEDITIRGEKAPSLILPRHAVTLIIRHPASTVPELARQKGKATMGCSADKPSSFTLDVFGYPVKVNWKPDKYGSSVEFSGPLSETGYQSKWLYPDEVKRGVKDHGSIREFLLNVAEKLYLTLHKTVAITVSKGFMTYPAAGGQMIVKAISGTYPDYDASIPRKNPVKVRFNSAEFLQNMEGAVPLTQEAVTLRINSGLTIQGHSPDMGDYKWRIPCRTEGKKESHIDMRFSAKFLLDAVKSFPATEVIMEISKSEEPCVVNGKAVVMPMRMK
jgi:DNA polymerase III sliding clamp (beta) subunit (PCNA family)